MKAPKLLCRVQKVFFFVFFLCVFILPTIQANSQESEINYNTYYRYPLSVGVEYQSLSPFQDYGSAYNIYEIAAYVRWPIPSLPVFQPTLHLGIINFDSQDAANPGEWDHRHYYGSAGILYSNRFSKNFEVGAEIAAGYSQAVFRNLFPGEGSVSSSNFIFEAGGRVVLSPSFNFSIDVHPNIKYLLSLSNLDDFDGLIFGIGFSAHYRFGQDPDSPTAIIRSIRFEETKLRPLFSAMQSYYVKYPVGKVRIANIEKYPIGDVNISFFQAGFMDSPTPSGKIPSLGAGETKEIDLFASFNEEVFRTEGTTPLTGEVVVTYTSKGKPAEQRQPVSYDLYDKTAITWDDDRKVAAFITPADSALRNYSSYVRQTTKDDVVPAYSEQVQVAMQVYQALMVIGLLYQADPTSPFTAVQDNPMVVDSVSLPRDTLKRSTGDCDDLTVLYNSLLETVGIETGFITTPGHIYSVFNTKTPTRQYREIHPDRNMTIDVNGELWVALEITVLGRSGFLEAWRVGMAEWNVYNAQADKRALYLTRKAQELYRSVVLKEIDLGLQYGSKESIQAGFKQNLQELIDTIVKDLSDSAQKSGAKEDYNKLGIAYVKFGQFGRAEQTLKKALQVDPEYTSAMANLGNLAFIQGDFQKALTQFMAALTVFKRKGTEGSEAGVKLLINISKTYNQMKQQEKAREYLVAASRIDKTVAEKYAAILQGSSGEARASERAGALTQVLFIDDRE